MTVAIEQRLIEGEIDARRARDLCTSTEPFTLAGVSWDPAAIPAVRKVFVRAQRVLFRSLADRETAAAHFGPGIYAKSGLLDGEATTDLALALDLDGHGRRIDQVTPTFDLRDAISDEAILIRDAARACGFAATVYAPMIAPAAAEHVEPFRSEAMPRADLCIYHFAIGNAAGEEISRMSGRRALWYHNITPGRFFERYAPSTATLLDEGREQLARVVSRFDVLIADSAYNAAELRTFGADRVDVVPYPIDYRRFDVLPAPSVRIPDAPIRWLSIGRIAPSKGLLRLVRAFASYAHAEPRAQLVLVGTYRPSDPFYLRLRFEIERLRLGQNVVVTGTLGNAELLALYESADLYVTLSEHEGFCVPLVEAMHFDLPIIASTAGAIPETLGAAAVMVEDVTGAEEIAALADVVRSDPSLRGRIVEAQRARSRAFLPEALNQPLRSALNRGLNAAV